VPSLNMMSNSGLATVSHFGTGRRGLQVTGGPGVVRMWWAVLRQPPPPWTPVGRMTSGNLERTVSTEVLPLMTDAGYRELAFWAGADNDVTQSSRQLFLQSFQRPVAPMRGCDISNHEPPCKIPT
jgi:hypothetical protein